MWDTVLLLVLLVKDLRQGPGKSAWLQCCSGQDCAATIERQKPTYQKLHTYSYPFMDTTQEYGTLDMYEKLIAELR
jgi:hypothetical protein